MKTYKLALLALGLGLAILLNAAPVGVQDPAARKVVLSKDFIDKNKLTDPDLQGIQFYILDEVALRRELRSSRVEPGTTITRTDSLQIEEIVIPAGTPCLVSSATDSTLAVSFAPPDTLQFSLNTGNSIYSLSGVKTEAGYSVIYRGKYWQMEPYRFVALYFDFFEKEVVNRTSNTVKGIIAP